MVIPVLAKMSYPGERQKDQQDVQPYAPLIRSSIAKNFQRTRGERDRPQTLSDPNFFLAFSKELIPKANQFSFSFAYGARWLGVLVDSGFWTLQ